MLSRNTLYLLLISLAVLALMFAASAPELNWP